LRHIIFCCTYLHTFLLAPSPVQDALLTLHNGIVEVTWEPPVTPNGMIYQYIVQRTNASGIFFQHISASQFNTSLPYFNDALVSIAAINLYGQSQFEHAESKGIHIQNTSSLEINNYVCTEACLPSPCINDGTCVTTMDGGSQEMFHCVCTPQFTGVYCETSTPRTNGNVSTYITYIHTRTVQG